MSFVTKLDYSDNRQIKQFKLTNTQLSGSTEFGVPFSALTGVLDSSIILTSTLTGITSTFSGNTTITNITFGDPRMVSGSVSLFAITDVTSGDTQTGNGFDGVGPYEIDGNTLYTGYTGSSYDFTVTSIETTGVDEWTGETISNVVQILSGASGDFTGRTIWVDVLGITKTRRLILADELDASSGATHVLSRGLSGDVVNFPLSGLTSTGLEALDEGLGIGWRLIGRPPSFYSDIGVDAVDFSLSDNSTFPQTRGAEGANAFATGYRTWAIGVSSFAEGNRTHASGSTSHSQGTSTRAVGNNSYAGGQENSAQSFCETTIGLFATDYNASSISSIVSTDRVFNIGIGTTSSIRKDGLTLYKSGVLTASGLTIAHISSGDPRTLLTREYFHSVSGGTTGGTPTLEQVTAAGKPTGNGIEFNFIGAEAGDRRILIQAKRGKQDIQIGD